jgi:hypothetical protein
LLSMMSTSYPPLRCADWNLALAELKTLVEAGSI